MIAIQNYTALPIGLEMEGGEIKACPKCGKNGLRTKEGAKTTYWHGLNPITGTGSGEGAIIEMAWVKCTIEDSPQPAPES